MKAIAMKAPGNKTVFEHLLTKHDEVNKDYAAQALLETQYFPSMKINPSEFPPIFTSEEFTLEVAQKLYKSKGAPKRSANWVDFTTRRFDGLVRSLGLPHPVPYASLVLFIIELWDEILPLLNSNHSKIKPSYNNDGRLVQMDYEDSSVKHLDETQLALGKRFLLEADISNCFPSIYTHAIDWAIQGKSKAKANIEAKTRTTANQAIPTKSEAHWASTLDIKVRACHNKESKGLLIGPAVSNLISELILQRIDEKLAVHEDISFIRFVDDYKIYCPSRESAEQALTTLQQELSVYKLTLNHRKTTIHDLSNHTYSTWITEIYSSVPTERKPLNIARFLQYCEGLAHQYPTKSILKFSIKALELDENHSNADGLVLNELVRLALFHPHILPSIASIMSTQEAEFPEIYSIFAHTISQILWEAAQRRETDVCLWALYLMYEYIKTPPDNNSIAELLSSHDTLIYTGLLALYPQLHSELTNKVQAISNGDKSNREEYWLIRYELWLRGLLTGNDICGDTETPWMEVLKKHNVSFIAKDYREALETCVRTHGDDY